MKKQIIVNELSRDLIRMNSAGAVIAGASGSGKSVLLNNIIYDLMLYDPNEYKAVFIDLKNGIELNRYKQIKHCYKFATNEKQAVEALKTVNSIMDIRYNLLRISGKQFYNGTGIIVFIDESAELLQSKQAIQLVQRLSRLSRAANIKQIMCTQSPNRKTIPADIALNMTYRLALHCDNQIESRQIINVSGAELLPWHGSALYKKPGCDLKKISIGFVPENAINERIKQNRKFIF